ncbi:PPE family protein [Mycobacterium haemophilum DSM 44634]|nr:PPE family protein [Mycobacterium haemophilum DSM 44634]
MDFGVLPPEVNSARMYAGLGSGPMLVAAAQWDGLAVELFSIAQSVQSVVWGLTASWLGAASALMAGATGRYVAWLSQTAAQAELTASQAKATAAAYEAAFAMTVPPLMVAENRAENAVLIATNLLGQNTPAIAINEMLYGEMWAQDAAAMYGYAGASAAAASATTPFEQAPAVVNEAGLGQQATATVQAVAQHAASQVMNIAPQMLQQLATPGAQQAAMPTESPQLLSATNSSVAPLSSVVSMVNNQVSTTNSGMSMTNTMGSLMKNFTSAATSAAQTVAQDGATAVESLGSTSGLRGSGVAASALPLTNSLSGAAETGSANTLGGLPLG